MGYATRKLPADLQRLPHQAVQLPEIVSHIISYLYQSDRLDDASTHSNNNTTASTTTTTTTTANSTANGKPALEHLYACLLVNRLWHDCAARIIWRSVSFDDSKADYQTLLKLATILDSTESVDLQKLKKDDAFLPVLVNPSAFHSESALLVPQAQPNSDRSSNSFTYPSTHASSPCQFGDWQGNQDPLSVKTAQPSVENLPLAHSHLVHYRNAIRSVTLRKIKEKSINEPLQKIGQHAARLERLDVYICDHVTNAALYPFLAHGQLTHISLAGCHRISDEAILHIAVCCKNLEHLDLRACGLVSDVSISAIARQCPRLRHLNVGRVRDRERITIESIRLIAKHTQVSVLGLAGCEMTDDCLIQLAKYRTTGLERISVNNCYRVTNKTVRAYVKYCPNLSVFEMKECHRIDDWEAVAELVQRKVLLTLCDQQTRACAEWARRQGRRMDVKAPLK